MANIKRIILTSQQLNEVMDSMKTSITFTGSTPNEMGANAKQEYNDAISSGLKPTSISFTGKSPRNNASDAEEANIAISTNTPDIGKAVTDAVSNYVNNGGDINKVNVTGNAEDITNGSTDESRIFSKRQIEEARLRKIHEGYKVTKKQLKEEWEEKPNDDANQWNNEFKMFIHGLRNGEAIEVGDNTIAVEIFKGKTASNDPRYVTFTKGDNRLQDDHFYIQHSPCLQTKYIREIYDCAGWEYDENCEDYEYLNEDEIDWNQRKQMRMDNFWDTLEYYIGLKDEQGSLNPQQLAHAEDVCNKLSCFGADAEEFCDYAREALGLNQIYEKVQKSKIEINPKNNGKFNATKERTGKSTEELTHSKNPLTRKRAIFAKNAKKWNKK